MTKSKVITIVPQPSKEWQGKQLMKDIVVFENGESGTVTTFPDNKQPEVGDELEYTMEDKGYGNEIKVSRPGGGGGGGFKPKQWTPQQVAQEAATKLTAAALQSGHLNLADYRQFFTECKSFLVAQIEADSLPI